MIKVYFIILLFLFDLKYLPAQWSISADLNGGPVNTLFSDELKIFAGTSSEGLFRSEDNGTVWEQINSGFENSLLIQSVSKKDNFYFAATSNAGVYRSSDNGKNWNISTSGITQLNVFSLISDGSNIYAGCRFAGIFYSTNNGSNWIRYGLGEGEVLNTMSYNENTFFAGMDGVIYRTFNQGMNWTTSFSGLTNLDIRSIMQFRNKTFCGTFGGGVFVSDNNGDNWTSVSSGLTDLRIKCLYSDGSNLFGGTFSNGIFLFEPEGEVWLPVNEGLTELNITALTSNGMYLFTGNSFGKIWRRLLSEIITTVKTEGSFFAGDFRLFQNFPNPFNPSTTITFYIPEEKAVSIIIYNGLGQAAEILHSGILKRGNHSMKWNADKFSAGTYYYRIQYGNISETKKLLLLK